MKQKLRNYISKVASYSEIYISMLTLLGIIIFSVVVVKDLYDVILSILGGNFDLDVESFLSHALQLVIGVEFIKMLAKHTPGSAIEVLLFAIARKMIIETNTMVDILIGVVAIAILFAIRKYLNSIKYESNKGTLVNGGTPIDNVNNMAKTNISTNVGKTIAGVIYNNLTSNKQSISVGSKVLINDAQLEVYSMDGDLIKQVLVCKINKL